MKVLLVSPKDPDKPGNLKHLMGGDNTFTRTLLSHPPSGVSYIHYTQALKEGRIVYSPYQKLLSMLMKFRILPPDAGIQSLKISDKFDLIHGHSYCLHLKNYSGPVVLSDSSSNLLFLRGYLGWGETRIRLIYAVRRLISRTLNIYDQNLNLRDAPLIVWSDFAKKLHRELGANPEEITVIPPGIKATDYPKHKHKGFNILFVGTWFQRKGGEMLLKAYQIIKRQYPRVSLTIIGQLPPKIKLPPDVKHKNYLKREILMRDVFPFADLLILIPKSSEGYGIVVTEAFSMGIPAIVTRVGALPEIVEDNISGFIIKPDDLNSLVDKVSHLINNYTLLSKIGRNAYITWKKKFSVEKTNRQLTFIYQHLLS